MKCYRVFGSTGEYSDHTEWSVKTFLSKANADQYCEKLKEWVKEYGQYNHINIRNGYKCPLDPNFRTDYTGTDYYVEEIELEN